MVIQRFFFISSLSFLLAGCAGVYETQPPAPLYRNQASQYVPPPPVPKQTKKVLPSPKTTPPVVKTQPLKEFNQALVPLAAPPQMINPSPEITEGSSLQPAFPEMGGNGTEAAPYSAPGSVQSPEAPGQEAIQLTPFQPIEPPASLSPAVDALVLAANENTTKGNIDTAAASLDRALKIEPRNPALYYKLALLKLKQNKPQEAENLARKSALLAAGDRRLKKHSWLLIAHAREMQRDFKGAQKARVKAESF